MTSQLCALWQSGLHQQPAGMGWLTQLAAAYQCRSMLSEGWNLVQLLVTLLWCAKAAADCPSTAITAAAAAALVGVALLQVYEGLAALHCRDFKQAADLLLDSIATFTT
jgi:hypothetical protein